MIIIIIIREGRNTGPLERVRHGRDGKITGLSCVNQETGSCGSERISINILATCSISTDPGSRQNPMYPPHYTPPAIPPRDICLATSSYEISLS